MFSTWPLDAARWQQTLGPGIKVDGTFVRTMHNVRCNYCGLVTIMDQSMRDVCSACGRSNWTISGLPAGYIASAVAKRIRRGVIKFAPPKFEGDTMAAGWAFGRYGTKLRCKDPRDQAHVLRQLRTHGRPCQCH